jgi:uncharacterized protein YbjT (DUF2867 family)
MSSTQAAVVLGASGSVGNALIKELIRNGSFKPIVTLVRRSQPDQVAMARDAGVELRETLVSAMDPAFVTPAKYKSITIEQIAKAMIATSQNTPAKSHIYHYPEMMALNG